MSEKEFLIYLDEAQENRYRYWHMWERGAIIEFRIQYEAFIEGRWRPIVRYDNAHGQPHRDILHPDESETKEWYHGYRNTDVAQHRAAGHHSELAEISGALREGDEPMSEFYRAKLSELMMEFTRYLIQHPDFVERIPKDAQVVLLDRQDPEYSRQALAFAQNARANDDVPDRPIVYVEVGALAPIRSRLQKVRVLNLAPAYAGYANAGAG